jgi:hypothetical protein
MRYRTSSLVVTALSFLLPMAAQVGGTGTTNRVALWTGSSTLGNSVLFQSGGNVGIGNTAPVAILDVTGKSGKSGVNGGNASTALHVIGGLGASSAFSGSAGGPIQAISGGGGRAIGAQGGTGAIFLITGASGAHCLPVGILGRCGPTYVGGNGGSMSLQPGSGGSSSTGGSAGQPGNITLAPIAGKVGVGTWNPTAEFEVGAGHSTLADSWITRSSRRFKTNIQPLADALEKIEQLQGVSYERKADGKHEIGVVAEDVDQIVPELVARDPETKEVQGVDYSRLSALLIEAVKTQQAEIQELKAQVRQLSSDRSDFHSTTVTASLEPRR